MYLLLFVVSVSPGLDDISECKILKSRTRGVFFPVSVLGRELDCTVNPEENKQKSCQTLKSVGFQLVSLSKVRPHAQSEDALW